MRGLCLLTLAATAALSACRPPIIVSECKEEADCPDGYHCDAERGYCVLSTLRRSDAGTGDMGPRDGAGTDRTGLDSSGSDAVGVDVAASDGSAADGLLGDSALEDAATGDGGGQDVNIEDAANADAYSLDAEFQDGAAADAYPSDAAAPDTAAPDSAAPDTAAPDAAAPDAAAPDGARPDSARPDSSAPDVVGFDVYDPVCLTAPDGTDCGVRKCTGDLRVQETCLDGVCADWRLIEDCRSTDLCLNAYCTTTSCMSYQLLGCSIPTGPLSDYDVSGDGRVMVAQASDSEVRVLCFDSSDGQVGSPAIMHEGLANTVEPDRVQIVTARDSAISLVTWLYRQDGADDTSRVFVSQLVSATCGLVGSPIVWPVTASSNRWYDTAIDADGNFVLFWQSVLDSTKSYLQLYDAAGAAKDAPVLVDDTERCRNDRSFRVVVNPETGNGVLSCQGTLSIPIVYRRFSMNGAAGDDPFLDDTVIPATPDGQAPNGFGHALGINASDHIAIQWQDNLAALDRARIFAWDGALNADLILGPTPPGPTANFLPVHQEVPALGSDFVFRDSEALTTFWRYSIDGVLQGCDQSVAPGHTLRSDGTSAYLQDSLRVVRGTLDFDRYRGCALQTCGNGVADPVEACDDGNASSLDGCTRFCELEPCGDGVVTGLETCDDGNFVDGDGCDHHCRLELPGTYQGFPIFPADDYDVAGSGFMVTVHYADGQLFATCFEPDRTLRRATFPVSELPWDGLPNLPMVVVSRENENATIVWSGRDGLRTVLLDSSCRMTRPAYVTTGLRTYAYDVAMDDAGNSVLAVGDGVAGVTVFFVDQLGNERSNELYLNCGAASFGSHVAVNQSSGAGVVTCQPDLADGALRLRRFEAGGTWQDSSAVITTAVPICCDSHTVGLNDLGDMVLVWRDIPDGFFHADFYPSGSSVPTSVVYSTRFRGEAQWYNSFEMRNQKVALVGENFIIGEAYVPGGGLTDIQIQYFEYSPDGQELSSHITQITSPYGWTIRQDLVGFTYLRMDGEIYYSFDWF